MAADEMSLFGGSFNGALLGATVSMSGMASGYLHPLYARSFEAFGAAKRLPACGGWLLERTIGGSPHRDAMGCYPLFCCDNWARLKGDLAALDGDIVSVALVTDPFGDVTPDTLADTFDVVTPFKAHFVSDMTLPFASLASKHHRYEARRALRTVTVEIIESPLSYLDEWHDLYGNLVQRHTLRGIKAFSREAFSKQLAIPGMVLVRGLCNGEIVSAQLWLQHHDVAYYHLAASNEEGYRQRAAYALTATVIEYFAGRARYLDLGAGPGLNDTNGNGLAAFKEGWSSETRPSYFCGKILNRRVYAELTQSRQHESYFPAYRAGEMS